MDSAPTHPATIIVMADEVLMYAWSGEGECLGHCGLRMIATHFMEHPSLSGLVDLEYEFWDWASTHPRGPAAPPARWREFHLKGIILARRLADLLRPLAVKVFYRSRPNSFVHEPLEMGPL